MLDTMTSIRHKIRRVLEFALDARKEAVRGSVRVEPLLTYDEAVFLLRRLERCEARLSAVREAISDLEHL